MPAADLRQFQRACQQSALAKLSPQTSSAAAAAVAAEKAARLGVIEGEVGALVRDGDQHPVEPHVPEQC